MRRSRSEFAGGSSPPQAAKCVRTNSRILHSIFGAGQSKTEVDGSIPSAPKIMPSYNVKLLSKKEVAFGTMAFELEKPAGFEFRPGQFVEIVFDDVQTDPRGREREFSIASSPNEPNILIATRIRDSGFKKVLGDLPLGSVVKMEGPFGSFTLPNDISRPVVILTGGIGITPFRSMVKYAAEAKLLHKIFLFYANRRPEDAAFLQELYELSPYGRSLMPSADLPKGSVEGRQLTTNNFKFIATMTKPELSKQSWKGETGYINMEMIKKYVDNIAAPIYYIAGPPAMVQAMWQMLKSAGVSDESIRTEEFVGY